MHHSRCTNQLCVIDGHYCIPNDIDNVGMSSPAASLAANVGKRTSCSSGIEKLNKLIDQYVEKVQNNTIPLSSSSSSQHGGTSGTSEPESGLIVLHSKDGADVYANIHELNLADFEQDFKCNCNQHHYHRS